MEGAELRRLREEKNLTEEETAKRLRVTPEDILAWEKGEAEPTVTQAIGLAETYGVSPGMLFLNQSAENPETIGKTAGNEKKDTPSPQVCLAICKDCRKPVFRPEDLVDIAGKNEAACYLCRSCFLKRIDKKRKEKIRETEEKRKLSYIGGSIAAVILLAIGIFFSGFENSLVYLRGSALLAVIAFTLVSCCVLDNNAVGEIIGTIFGLGFVRMPGVIFSLDLGGLIFLVAVKLLLSVLSMCIAAVFGILALAIGGVCSVFVYPFALRKSYLHPEKD